MLSASAFNFFFALFSHLFLSVCLLCFSIELEAKRRIKTFHLLYDESAPALTFVGKIEEMRLSFEKVFLCSGWQLLHFTIPYIFVLRVIGIDIKNTFKIPSVCVSPYGSHVDLLLILLEILCLLFECLLCTILFHFVFYFYFCCIKMHRAHTHTYQILRQSMVSLERFQVRWFG